MNKQEPKTREWQHAPNNRTTTGFRISDEPWAVLEPLLPLHINTHRFGACLSERFQSLASSFGFFQDPGGEIDRHHAPGDLGEEMGLFPGPAPTSKIPAWGGSALRKTANCEANSLVVL